MDKNLGKKKDVKNFPNPEALNTYLETLDEQIPVEPIDFPPGFIDLGQKKQDNSTQNPQK